LIVGLHDDETLLKYKGKPSILNLHERMLGCLSCRYVDDVVIGAPYEVDKEILEYLKIKYVVHGTSQDDLKIKVDPYKVKKQLKEDPKRDGII
jgi:ethanolamine-phosphate cytidylyltransferase